MPHPSPSLFLLGCRVYTCPRGSVGGRILTSGSKMAFGFLEDDEAESVVRRLKLESEPVGTDLFFLTLFGCSQYSCIHTVDKNLILIDSAFIDISSIEVLLIYDTIDSSLRMIPTMPCSRLPFCTNFVLVARRPDDDGDKSYALAFPGTVGSQEVLFLSLSTSTSTSRWLTKKISLPDRCFPQFDARQVFSFRGRGYWVDLLCNVLYCDCSQVLSDDIDCVEIRSLDLPAGCKMDSVDREKIAEVKAFRAMGPVGDSIKFVSMDGYLEHVEFNDCKVRVWTLMADMSWALECELKFENILSPAGLAYDMNRGLQGNFEGLLPVVAPMYPFLSTEEDNAIYFALGRIRQGEKGFIPREPMLMLHLDMHRQTMVIKQLSEPYVSDMDSHLAVSSDVAEKLLRGSC